MILWLDAQLSPAMAVWLRMRFDLDAFAVREVGLRDAEDEEIFAAARSARVVVMTKDSDFVELLQRRGPPPQIIWLRSGNTSNARLKVLLTHALPAVLLMLKERVLFPAVRAAGEADLVVAPAFSCRHQIADVAMGRSVSTAELLAMAGGGGNSRTCNDDPGGCGSLPTIYAPQPRFASLGGGFIGQALPLPPKILQVTTT